MPILVKSHLFLVSFLVAYDMCNYICLVMEAMFWCDMFDRRVKIVKITLIRKK